MDGVERQTEDGTFYKQVSPGKWQMVTRETTDGTIYKKVGDKKWSPVETTKQADPGWGEAFRAKVANAATLGYAPELYAGGKQLIEDVQSVLPGGHEADQGVYDRELANYRNYTRNLEAQHPVASFTGSLIGYAAPGSAISKGVRAAKVMTGLAPEAATLLGKSATLGAEGAVFGAAHRPNTDQDAVNIPERVDTAAANAVFGMALPVAGEAIKRGYSAIKTVPKKILSVFGGVDEGTIDTFLKNPDEYLSAKPREEVMQTITDLVNNVNNKVAEGKSSVKEAKESLRWAGQQIRESASENHAIAREQLRQAETNLADKFKETVQDIKSKPEPTYLQGQIDDTLRSMKKQNIDASKESFDILQGEVGARQKAIDSIKPQMEAEPPKTTINVKSIYSDMKKRVVDLSSRNSSDAKAAAKRLSEYMQDLKEKTMDPEGNTTWWMDAAEAKRIIQDLDSDVQTWDSSKIAGAFDDKFNQNLKIMRNSIDTKLKKEFPAYKAKMNEISERAKILSEGSKRFGNPQLAYSRLSNIGSDKAKFDRELLSKLGKQSGQDFDTPIAEYVANQKLLKDPKALEKIRRELPEFDQLTEAQQLEKLAQIDKGPKAFREKLKKSPSFKDLKMAEKDFDSALVDRDKIKGWTEATVASKIKSVMRGREYITKQLEALGKMSDQDLVRMVDQLRVNDAFEREFRIGSRNVNLWTAMGVGTVGGGPVGLITGAVIGGFIDRYGPKITKQILIGVSKIRGNPTVSKLMAVKIPRPIAKELADSFYGSVLGLSTMESKKSIVNRSQGQAKWANDGYEKVKVYAQDKEDLDLLSEMDKLNQDNPAVRDTLIELSDFRPGSVGFERALKKLRTVKQSGD